MVLLASEGDGTGFDSDSLTTHAVVGNTLGDLAIMEAKLKHGRS